MIGGTDDQGKKAPTDPVAVGDLHAVGIDPGRLNQTPIGRTVRFAEGKPVKALLKDA